MMKRFILTVAFAVSAFIAGSLTVLNAQDEPKPKKDSVNMDTIAKPQFYYALEDEETSGTRGGKGTASTIVVIAGAVIIATGVVYSLLKKKK